LAPIHERLKRAGAHNVQVRTPKRPPPIPSPASGGGLGRGKAASQNDELLSDLTGRIDLVLIDAPCTGTGVWRRNPDAKWRVRPGALAERLKEQAAVLDRAVPLLKPGGRIAYVTCSVLNDENGDQVRAFLARHPNFAAVPPVEVSNALGERTFLFKRAVLMTEEGLLMTPRRTDTDGFFVAILRHT
jgi:16S rRNA (cytosine967-C5)-methyltransferase